MSFPAPSHFELGVSSIDAARIFEEVHGLLLAHVGTLPVATGVEEDDLASWDVWFDRSLAMLVGSVVLAVVRRADSSQSTMIMIAEAISRERTVLPFDLRSSARLSSSYGDNRDLIASGNPQVVAELLLRECRPLVLSR